MSGDNMQFPNTNETERGFILPLEALKIRLKREQHTPFILAARRKHGSMTAELFAPQGEDTQKPHAQDEIYVIVSGQGTFEYDGQRAPFKTGDLLYVAAHTAHKFAEFSDDFCTWVIFYGEKSSNPELSMPPAPTNLPQG